MRVSLKCTCALQLLLWRHACLSSAHVQTTMWHCCLSNKVGGSRRGLSIQLSGIFSYPACPWNQGVRIIEVVLYSFGKGHTTYNHGHNVGDCFKALRHALIAYSPVASIPGRLNKAAWYTLYAHAQNN